MAWIQRNTITWQNVLEETQIADLQDKYFKSIVINMLKDQKKVIDKELKENRKTK